jgi:hypothetical protein
MTLLAHVTNHNGQELWLNIFGVCRYKVFIFAYVGTNNVNQFTTGNMDNVAKYANVKHAEAIHNYKCTKEKLYRTNMAIWYNRACKIKQLTTKRIDIRIQENNKHSTETKNVANKYGLIF